MGMRGQCWMVKNSGVKVSSDATPLATLSRQVSVVDEVCREAVVERTDLNCGKNPKRPAVSGLWWGLLWVYHGFSMIFFCWFKVQTTGLFRWWKNIFPNVEMVFTHRLEFETFSIPRCETRCLPQSPGVSSRKTQTFWRGPRESVGPETRGWDSLLGVFFSKVFCQWIFKAWLFEESLRSIFYDGNPDGLRYSWHSQDIIQYESSLSVCCQYIPLVGIRNPMEILMYIIATKRWKQENLLCFTRVS